MDSNQLLTGDRTIAPHPSLRIGNITPDVELEHVEHSEMSDIDAKDAGASAGHSNDASIPSGSAVNSALPAPPSSDSQAQTDNENTKPPALTSSVQATLTAGPSSSTEPSTIPPSVAPISTDLSPAPQISTSSDSAAIGTETVNPDTPVVNEPGSVLVLTLLLPASEARHPYKIDEKYLTKRNVPMPGTTESGRKDPFSISVYTLKELILREWREEWEPKPSSPSSIRLIHFGRLLDDKITLKGSANW